eukprot:gene16803-18499_t
MAAVLRGDDSGDITANLKSLAFETGLSEDESELLFIRKRSHALRTSVIAQASYLIAIINEGKNLIYEEGSSKNKKATSRVWKEIPKRRPLKVGLIGCGGLGKALVSNLLRYSDLKEEEIFISSRRPETLTELTNLGIQCFFDNKKLVRMTDITFICCLPSQFQTVAETFVNKEKTQEFNWNYEQTMFEALENASTCEKTCPGNKRESIIHFDGKLAEIALYTFVNMCIVQNLGRENIVRLVNTVIFGPLSDDENPSLSESDIWSNQVKQTLVPIKINDISYEIISLRRVFDQNTDLCKTLNNYDDSVTQRFRKRYVTLFDRRIVIMEGTGKIAFILLVLCGISLEFDMFSDESLIPSDGFHDLLGLTPFWMTQHMQNNLRRSLTTKRDNLPSAFEDFVATNDGTKSYEIAGNCNLKGTFTSDMATLEVQESGGCTKPSLAVIFEKIFPTINLEEATEKFILPDQFEMKKLQVDKSSKEVTIDAVAKDTLGFVERLILVQDATLTLGFTAGEESVVGMENWMVKIEGNVMIAAVHRIKMSIDKPKGRKSLPFSWKIDMVKMFDLFGIFGITAQQLNFNELNFDSSKLAGVVFKYPKIKGQLDLDDTFQIVAKASVSFSKAIRDGDIWAIMTKPEGKTTKPAVMIDIKDTTRVKSALDRFMTSTKFIRDFGMIGKIRQDCIIMVSKSDITMVEDDEIMELVGKFITEHDTKEVPKGVHVRVLVPMKENIREECKSSNASFAADIPDIMPITITINAGGLGFAYPEKFASDLPSMMKCLDPKVAAQLPSQLFPRPEGLINMKEFSYSVHDKSIKLVIVLQGPFSFIGGKINISDIELTVSKEADANWQFEGYTTLTVGPFSVALTIAKDGGTYTFTAHVESFKIDQLEELIGPNTITEFVGLLGNVSDFGIKNFKLIKEMGESSTLRVTGTPILWGFEKTTIEGIVWKPGKEDKPETAVAVGIVIEEARLDKLIEKIYGSNLFSYAWFSEMTAICIISNTEAKVESEEEEEEEEEDRRREFSSSSEEQLQAANEQYAGQKQHKLVNNLLQKNANKRSNIVEILKRSAEKQLQQQFQQSFAPGSSAQRQPAAAQQVAQATPGQQFAQAATGQQWAQATPGQAQVAPGQAETLPKVHSHAAKPKVAFSRRAKKVAHSMAAKRSGDDESEEEDDDEPAIKFEVPLLSDQEIQQGLTLIGIFKIPQDDGCKGDAMCLWLGEKVGKDATIEIMGAIGNGGFKFSAAFTGTIVLVPEKLSLKKVELALELNGKDSNVRISCLLYWADKDILGEDQIKFQGAIELGITGKLSLEFDMMGMWTKPFGFEYLAFGNMHLAIGISVGVPVPSFEFGAEIWVGKIKKGSENNDHAIKIAGYFGVNVNNPTDNYVFAKINAFTLKKIFEAFELGEPSVPDFVANSGFPEGITVAYSSEGKEIEAHDINIEAGLYLKGTINFLGYSVAAEIQINPGEDMKVDIQLSPIDWAGGLIALRKSESDKENGPRAFIYMGSEALTVEIEGYISLLGMSGEVKIAVSETSFEFHMVAKLWDMIHAELYVSAAYGSMSTLAFEFKASISINLHLKEIFNAVKDFMKKAAEAAIRVIEAAKKKLEAANKALENADKKMVGWKSSMSAYQAKLAMRAVEIERQKANMVEDCKAKCGKVCIPFFDWKPQCFKVFWWWVGCPVWNSCKWRGPNILCIAGCEINKLANKFVAIAEQVGIGIMIGLTEIGKGLVDVGRGFVKLAGKLVDFAKVLLDLAKKAVEVGKRIAEAVTDWLADNLFEIRLLEITGKLDSDFNACVGLKVDCTILGLKIDFEGKICINLNFWKGIAADSVEKKYPGVKKQEEEVKKVEGKFEEFDKDKSGLDKEEKKIDEDVKKETSQKRKRDYVPTEEEAYYRRLAEERLPTVVTRSAETVDAFKNNAPWVLIQDFDAHNFDHTPQQDTNIPAEKRTLDEDWDKHAATPCVQVSKVIDKYTMIADGLASVSQSMREVHRNYQATKRSYQQGVDSLKYQVDDTEFKHNITHEEKTDLHHWYNEAKEGLEKWDAKAKSVIEEQHQISMPVFRSQIEHILMTEKKTTFPAYMNELHKIGEKAYKRSSIPNEAIIAATQELSGIKRDLVSIVTDEEANPLTLMGKVKSIVIMEGTGKIAFILLVLCGISLEFDMFSDESLIPSDGFHDLLGLTPFWMTQHMQNNLRRSLTTKRDNLPGTLADFLSESSGTKTYEMAGNCNLKGTFTSELATLQVEEAGECVKPSLTVIFQKLFPTINVNDATQEFILSDQFDFKKLEVVKSSKEVTIEASAKDTLDYSERRILVSEGELTLGFSASGSSVLGIENWRIKIEGIVGISSHRVKMIIDKPKGETSLPFTWEIPMVLMVDLMGIFGITASAMNFNDVGFDSTKLEGITFTGATINGQLELDDTFQIVAKASVALSQAVSNGEVWLILTRPTGSTTKAAIIIDVKDTINIQEALEVFITQKDFISDFGMIGRIERDCIIMLAKDDITMVQNEDLMTLVGKFITPHDTKQIPKGVNVRVLVPMKDNMKTQCKASTAQFSEDVPEILPITIKITAGGLAFSYPDKFKSDLPSMLKCLDPQIAAELPSQLFPRPDGLINIKEFTFAESRYMKLTVVLQGPFEFIGGKIKVADIELTVSKTKGEQGTSWQFAGVTTVTIGPLAVGLTIEKEGGKYTFSAYVESFKLNQLEEMIGRTTITDVARLLGSLSDFGIKDFKLVKEFGESSQLRVSGVPIIWGWDKMSIEGLVWTPKGETKTAVSVGIVIEAVRLDKLLEKILGNNLFSTAWFSKMTAICIISTDDAKIKAQEAENSNNKVEDDSGEADSNTPDSTPDNAEEHRSALMDKQAAAKKPSVTNQQYHHHNQHRRSDILKVARRSLRQKLSQSLQTPHARTLEGKERVAPLKSRLAPADGRAAAIPTKRKYDTQVRTARSKFIGKHEKKVAVSKATKRADDEVQIKFNIPYLTSQTIQQGLTFIAIFNIPQDNGCHGDSLCLWLGEKVGRDATIEIMGAIGNDGFRFSAKFSGTIVLVPDKLTLQEIELALELSGKKSSVKLSCTLYWADRDILGEDQIQFQGAIEVSLTGKLSLEFNMMGMWTQPFGFEYLAFGNLHLAIGISVGVPLPSFVWFGKIKKGIANNDHAIKIAGYFGVNVNDPRDNYVYASVNAFTLRKIFEAFELGSPSMPDFIADTGFPDGITVAYSTTGKVIEAHDINIAPGFLLKGTINFLGLTVSADIQVQPKEKLKVDIQMSPIDWANGLIVLRRSETDKENGPKAFIYITTSSVTVQINGYISLLGMSREVSIDVSDTAFTFRMTTDLWGMIRTELYVNAAYGSLATLAFESALCTFRSALCTKYRALSDECSSTKQSFLYSYCTPLCRDPFRASVSIDFHLREIFNAVKDFMKKAADSAIEAINAAKRKVAEAQEALDNANNKMTGWQSSMTAYQDKLRQRSAEIERQKANMVQNCKAKCGKVCVPFLDWKSRCFKIWWWWIMIGLTEIGKGLIDVGKGFVSMASKLVDFGNDVLDFAISAVKLGKQIADAVTDWLAENLFEIRLLELNGKLDNEFNACVGLKVDCTILGLKIDYEGEICINLNFWKNLAADTVDKKYPGVKKQEEELKKVDGKFEEFEKDKTDLGEEEEKIDKDVKQETSQRRKRDYVPTEEEAYYRRLAEERLPTVVTRSAETVNAFKNNAPWVLIQDFDAHNFDHKPQQDTNIPAEKRTLDEDWDKHAATPCVQVSKVIDKYSMIADGLASVSQSMRDVRRNYQATKRSYEQGVDSLKYQVNDAELKHNITHEEKTDLHHWYNEAKEGLEKWDAKAKSVIEEQHQISMPVFRSQLEHILRTEKKTTFPGYMNELHKIGEKAYKRSSIPNEAIIAATQELSGIKRDLVSIVTDEEANPLTLMGKVKSVRSNIQGLRRSMERCN